MYHLASSGVSAAGALALGGRGQGAKRGACTQQQAQGAHQNHVRADCAGLAGIINNDPAICHSMQAMTRQERGTAGYGLPASNRIAREPSLMANTHVLHLAAAVHGWQLAVMHKYMHTLYTYMTGTMTAGSCTQEFPGGA